MRVATWPEVGAAAPELAEAVRALFDAHRHKTLATLRRDGSPRISGIEAVFVDGELWSGGWADSRKVRDQLRDPRFALHSGTANLEGWQGDAKVAGRAVAVTDPARIAAVVESSDGGEPPGPTRLFRTDVTEAVVARPGDPPDHLVIEFWRDGHGVRRVERR